MEERLLHSHAWLIATVLLVAVTACGSRLPAPSVSFVDPRDGQVYPVVRIGGQTWLARDLSYQAAASYCYGDSPGACPPNGRLYPWDVAVHACPAGWHLPSEEEWRTLERHLGMAESELAAEGFRGTDQGASLRAGGDSGFDSRITGYRRPDGSYARRGERSAYWLATPADDDAAWHRDLRSDDGRIYRSAVPKGYALSVRCLEGDREADASAS